ncbi:MAG: hypothetical protein OEY14_14045, partial [Myxococcales bacterium]|nr:hypothetical protein [Myxococcales bacterium]
MFEQILIAQRGEAATRIARTCRRLGVRTLGLLAPGGEVDSPGQACDALVPIEVEPDGRPTPAEIARVAQEQGVDAVHPGYQDHRWQEAMLRALEGTKIALIGATLESLGRLDPEGVGRAVGEAGLRFVGSTEPISEQATLLEEASRLGYPIRCHDRSQGEREFVAEDEEDLLDGLIRQGAGPFVLESFIYRPRVIDVTVVSGLQVEALAERESSIAISGQVLLVESPSPELAIRADGEALR